MVTFKQVKEDSEVKKLMEIAERNLQIMEYTNHGYRHASYVAATVGNILRELEFDEHTVELGKIAGFLHDIGCAISRKDHEITGGMLAYPILQRLGMDVSDIIKVTSAIGHHDESNGAVISHISAALVIADKSDIHKSRVCKTLSEQSYDVHDFVNLATIKNWLVIDRKKDIISLHLIMDETSSPMELLSIYAGRMLFCEKAAEILRCKFRLIINDNMINNDKTIKRSKKLVLTSSEMEVSANTEREE